MPGASMLTKVIIMAASGKGGTGRWPELTFSSSSTGLAEREFELRGSLLGVGDGGLVAVVAVGDDQFFVRHRGQDQVDQGGVGELPDTVDDVVLVGDGEVGGRVSLPSLPAPNINFSAVNPGSE